MSGPVVTAARAALATEDVELVLPFVPAGAEEEVRHAFNRVLPMRALGQVAGELAEQWFDETVVRLHRAGEGAPFTGLKPAGTDEGPVLPLAEKAVESGSTDRVHALLSEELRQALRSRLDRVLSTAAERDGSVAKAREHVEATLGFEVFCHHLHQAITSG
ncbi:hypothetical protein FNH05_32780 [Amycolatopsis rhizosphaerae]|uniref:Uncharacterized protein n=1 Tax=Amycolatopsis rhizosphaerae TaxID=2053003 RepID=A0A558AI43_9PSEU|nr:DUF6448 family protein [Amycolatopsis rhizosphaerae]TVT23944.1 hypothetical protein FNH05_32780 [Amycolatopsis rhizosphaerae]